MKTVHSFFLGAAIFGLASCGGGGGSSPAPSPTPPPVSQNQTPVANAGTDQSILEDGDAVLDGLASSDPDGSINTYRWRQTAGPDVSLLFPNNARAVFTGPTVTSVTEFEFELTVTDNQGASATDRIRITVSPDPVDDAEVVTLEIDGKTRVYTLYVPDTFTDDNPAVLLLHGGGGSMRDVLGPDRTTRRWVEIADRDGTLLIIPNGFNSTRDDGLGDDQSWNDLRASNAGTTSDEDDFGFLLTVLDDAETRADYDDDDVFVTGSSNGGIMTMTLLILAPDRFEAGAAFIAALPEEAIPDPSDATPFFMLNGTEDPLILFEGGPVAANGSPTRSVADTVAYWTRVTESVPSTEVFSSLPNTVPDDDCEITVSEFRDDDGDPSFIYYEAIGGGHSIPDPEPPLRSQAVLDLIGNQCREAQGVDLVDQFFQSIDD